MTKWRLVGWDTFEGADYPLSEHDDEEACVKAARDRLRILERDQPTAQSGGQDGIQDQVFIETPDGIRYRFRTKALVPIR
jgi:hypothetical protein